MSSTKKFSFKYIVTTSLTFDDLNVHVSSGPLIKRDFPIGSIQNYYSYEHKVDTSFLCLYLNYTDGKGKTKKLRLASSVTSSDYAGAIKELETILPGKSLNHLASDEALKQMKAINPQGPWVYLFAWLFLMAVLALYYLPELVHTFDFGSAKANVSELTAGKDLGTRNVILSGRVLDYPVQTTHSSRLESYEVYYCPLVTSEWKQGDSIQVILRSREEISVKEEYPGIVRNAAWEEVSPGVITFLNDNYSLLVKKNPVLFEIRAEKIDWIDRLFPAGIAVLITIILFVRYRSKKLNRGAKNK